MDVRVSFYAPRRVDGAGLKMKRASKELKRIARDLLNDRYSIPIGAFLTAGLIPAVLEFPFLLSAGTDTSAMQLTVHLIARFLIALIAHVLETGVIYMHLNMTRKKAYSVSQIFYPLKNGTERYFGAAFLLSLFFVISCLPAAAGGIYFYLAKFSAKTVWILSGAILLSVIFVAVCLLNYNFVSFFLLDYPKMKVWDSFLECRRLMKGNKRRFLFLALSFFGWGFLIFFSFGIASLWVKPYLTQTMVNFYLDCTTELDRIPVRD